MIAEAIKPELKLAQTSVMRGENIICFAKDWSEHPTSCNHVLTELAKHNRVLWLNSISMRSPSLSNGRDIRKIFTKIAKWFGSVKNVQDDLWTYTPIVLPFPHNKLAVTLNRQILKLSLGILRRKLGMKEYQLWTFLPNVAEYFDDLKPTVSVYYCVDDWASFPYLDSEKINALERSLCEKADIVFATARLLVERKKETNTETHLATHGVDHARFSAALDARTVVPSDIASLPGPIIGFFGTIEDRLDLPLIAHLADSHPEWSIVMIGQELVDTSDLRKRPNIHFLGSRHHSELPAYCKGFSVGLIPFLTEMRMQSLNPIKLREYLSAGLPVVSTALREVMHYDEYCYIGDSHEEIERAIVAALDEDTPAKHRWRSDVMLAETWEHKVAQVSTQVMRVKANNVRK